MLDEVEDVKGKLKIVELLSDIARLLCDTHWQHSETRRYRLTLDWKVTRWLFGYNLEDRSKSAKAIQRSGEDLKQRYKPMVSHKTLNFKSPPDDRSTHAQEDTNINLGEDHRDIRIHPNTAIHATEFSFLSESKHTEREILQFLEKYLTWSVS